MNDFIELDLYLWNREKKKLVQSHISFCNKSQIEYITPSRITDKCAISLVGEDVSYYLNMSYEQAKVYLTKGYTKLYRTMNGQEVEE